MRRQRFAMFAVYIALAGLSMAGTCRAADPEPGTPSEFTSGSPYSFRPLDPYWAYRAMPTPPPRYARLNDSPIFMTSINFPGVYGAYTFGIASTSYYDRSPYFTPDAAPAGFALPATESSLRVAAFPSPRTARIDVIVPTADSDLTFDNTRTTPTGINREFITPPLIRGGKFVYNVRVTWVDDGVRRTRDKNVFVEAGDRMVVDLTTGRGTYDGPSLRLAPEAERPAVLRPQVTPQNSTTR